MKRCIRILCFFSILMLYCGKASAVTSETDPAEYFGTDQIVEAVPDEAKELLDGLDPIRQTTSLSETVMGMLERMAEQSFSLLYGGIKHAVGLLLLVIFCRLIELSGTEHSRSAIRWGGILAVSAVSLSAHRYMTAVFKRTLTGLTDFSMTLHPIMATAAAASGSAAAAAANYGLTVFFSNLLLHLCTSFVLPLTYAYLALSLTDAVVDGEKLKRLREFLCWIIEMLLKTVVYAYTGLLTLTGVLAGSVDASKMKAAKQVIASMIPVVGGIISGAAQTVLSGVDLLKSSVGTYGMLAVFAIVFLPFLQIAVHYICLKLAAGLSGLFSETLTGFLDAAGKAMGYLLGMTGSGALICLLSCCCYVKVVHIL